METIVKSVSRGANGPDVKLIQEWLTLDGIATAIDSDFGPATEKAISLFQERNQIGVTGIVGIETWQALSKPITSAVQIIPQDGMTRAQLTVAYAQQHLLSRPREVGGENCGPWVRLYCAGQERLPWCAAFASYCLKQAWANAKTPIAVSYSCDALAASGKATSRFMAFPATAAGRNKINPGSFFLIRKPDGSGWHHTGIVTAIHLQTFETIEGNTNDDGSREGYEVCARVRAFNPAHPVDFILM